MRRVARWDLIELDVAEDVPGPVEAWFTRDDRRFFATAFPDRTGQTGRRVRFMPDQEGLWEYAVRVGDREQSGRFRCTPAEPGVHGPVRVAHRTRFAFADGTRFVPVGLACEPSEVGRLAGSPFGKARLPADLRRPAELEQAVRTLRDLGVEADLCLEIEGHGWEQRLIELVARVGAYRNVWWSLPAGNPCSGEAARIVREYDCGAHLLSLHGGHQVDAGAPWLTHASVRSEDVRSVSRLVERIGKPVVVDDCGSTGDGPELVECVPAEELLTRVWEGVCRGGFVTWRGPLGPEMTDRIALLHELLADAPPDLRYHAGDYDAATLRAHDSFVLQHHGRHRFPARRFEMPVGEHRIEIIDTWSGGRWPVPGTFTGAEITVPLPAEPYQAIRVVRTAAWSLVDDTGTRVVSVDETDRGAPRIELSWVGDPDPYLTVPLRDLVTCSFGKPWRPESSGMAESWARREGDALVLDGRLGDLAIRLELTFVAERLAMELVAYASGEQVCTEVAVGLRFPTPSADPIGVTMPGLVYRGNRGSDDVLAVPRPGPGLVVERHRLPIPCVSAEWGEPDRPRQLTVFGMADGMSLGVLPGTPVAVTATSGVLMFDGAPDTAYIHKGERARRFAGYRTVTADRPVRIRCELDWGPVPRLGEGHRAVLAAARRVFPAPRAARPLALDQIIELKTRALDARWNEREGKSAGYLKFPAGAPHYLYGWTGQCLRLAWCDARLGLTLGEPERVDRCRRAVDFYVDRSATEVAGLRYPLHWVQDDTWSGFDRPSGQLIPARAYGETVCDLIDVIELWCAAGWSVPASWRRAVDEAVSFIRDGAERGRPLPLGWRTDGSAVTPGLAAGLPCVEVLARGGDVESAAEIFQTYGSVAWARSTLDAACEDKESGIAYLRAALALADATGDEGYRRRAEHAAEWLSTWVYAWNPGYPEGSRFRREGFSAVGWSTVSVQNHHLDVFFPYWEMARLGYTETAKAMLGAVGQGICRAPGDWGFDTVGEQAEGYFQTDWQHRGEVNTWNPSWVIAQVLSNALRLKEDAP